MQSANAACPKFKVPTLFPPWGLCPYSPFLFNEIVGLRTSPLTAFPWNVTGHTPGLSRALLGLPLTYDLSGMILKVEQSELDSLSFSPWRLN